MYIIPTIHALRHAIFALEANDDEFHRSRPNLRLHEAMVNTDDNFLKAPTSASAGADDFSAKGASIAPGTTTSAPQAHVSLSSSSWETNGQSKASKASSNRTQDEKDFDVKISTNSPTLSTNAGSLGIEHPIDSGRHDNNKMDNFDHHTNNDCVNSTNAFMRTDKASDYPKKLSSISHQSLSSYPASITHTTVGHSHGMLNKNDKAKEESQVEGLMLNDQTLNHNFFRNSSTYNNNNQINPYMSTNNGDVIMQSQNNMRYFPNNLHHGPIKHYNSKNNSFNYQNKNRDVHHNMSSTYHHMHQSNKSRTNHFQSNRSFNTHMIQPNLRYNQYNNAKSFMNNPEFINGTIKNHQMMQQKFPFQQQTYMVPYTFPDSSSWILLPADPQLAQLAQFIPYQYQNEVVNQTVNQPIHFNNTLNQQKEEENILEKLTNEISRSKNSSNASVKSQVALSNKISDQMLDKTNENNKSINNSQEYASIDSNHNSIDNVGLNLSSNDDFFKIIDVAVSKKTSTKNIADLSNDKIDSITNEDNNSKQQEFVSDKNSQDKSKAELIIRSLNISDIALSMNENSNLGTNNKLPSHGEDYNLSSDKNSQNALVTDNHGDPNLYNASDTYYKMTKQDQHRFNDLRKCDSQYNYERSFKLNNGESVNSKNIQLDSSNADYFDSINSSKSKNDSISNQHSIARNGHNSSHSHNKKHIVSLGNNQNQKDPHSSKYMSSHHKKHLQSEKKVIEQKNMQKSISFFNKSAVNKQHYIEKMHSNYREDSSHVSIPDDYHNRNKSKPAYQTNTQTSSIGKNLLKFETRNLQAADVDVDIHALHDDSNIHVGTSSSSIGSKALISSINNSQTTIEQPNMSELSLENDNDNIKKTMTLSSSTQSHFQSSNIVDDISKHVEAGVSNLSQNNVDSKVSKKKITYPIDEFMQNDTILPIDELYEHLPIIFRKIGSKSITLAKIQENNNSNEALNSYSVEKNANLDKNETLIKTFKSSLNKISPSNYESIAAKILDVIKKFENDDVNMLNLSIIFYKKSTVDKNLIVVFADLLKLIHDKSFIDFEILVKNQIVEAIRSMIDDNEQLLKLKTVLNDNIDKENYEELKFDYISYYELLSTIYLNNFRLFGKLLIMNIFDMKFAFEIFNSVVDRKPEIYMNSLIDCLSITLNHIISNNNYYYEYNKLFDRLFTIMKSKDTSNRMKFMIENFLALADKQKKSLSLLNKRSPHISDVNLKPQQHTSTQQINTQKYTLGKNGFSSNTNSSEISKNSYHTSMKNNSNSLSKDQTFIHENNIIKIKYETPQFTEVLNNYKRYLQTKPLDTSLKNKFHALQFEDETSCDEFFKEIFEFSAGELDENICKHLGHDLAEFIIKKVLSVKKVFTLIADIFDPDAGLIFDNPFLARDMTSLLFEILKKLTIFAQCSVLDSTSHDKFNLYNYFTNDDFKLILELFGLLPDKQPSLDSKHFKELMGSINDDLAKEIVKTFKIDVI